MLESTTQTLTASFEKREQVLMASNEKLGEQLKQLKNDYHALDKDYARQEHSISLLERERGEFYQEFTVMRKQFEQMPKWQQLIDGQMKLANKIEAIDKDKAHRKTK